MAEQNAWTFFAQTPDDEDEPNAVFSAPDAPRPGRLRRHWRWAAVVAAAAVVVSTVSGVAARSAYADPSPSAWSRLRMCESSDNYSINTGNGYYGAYQFNLATWRSVGGSGHPNQASKAEQDARALILYRERGWQPWTCASILGFRDDSDARSGRISDIHLGPSTSKPVSKPKPVAPVASGTVPAWPGPQYYSYGDTSTTIKRFQNQMHARGFIPAGTGQYGPLTKAVIVRLQSLNGLAPNGLLGPNTWKLAWTGKYTPASATTKAITTVPAWPGPQYYSYGDTSTTIKRFQNEMHARGLFPAGTGQYGPLTKAMIVRLQKLNGLVPNGLLGPNTWKLAWTGKY